MAMRLSGLASGMDTEAVVEQLMKAHNLKKTKIQNKITTTEWKQEKWKDLNSKIYSFYTNQLSKIRLQGNWSVKKATTSNTNKVDVTASTSAPEGTHRIEVKQLASAQFVTGSQLGNNVNTKTKLSELFDVTDGTAIHIKTAKKPDGVKLEVRESTTLGDFINALKDAGLNANYDSTHKRIFISSKESGTENGFSIYTTSNEALKAKNVVRDTIGYDSLSSATKSKVDGLIDDYRKADNAEKKNGIVDDILKAIEDEYEKELEKFKKNKDNIEAAEKQVKDRGNNYTEEQFKEEVEKILNDNAKKELDKKYPAISRDELKTELDTYADSDDASDPRDKIKKLLGVTSAGDQKQIDNYLNEYIHATPERRTKILDELVKYKDDVDLGELNEALSNFVNYVDNSKLINLGLGEIYSGSSGVMGNSDVKVIKAENAEIVYNNVELSGSSNSFNVNGLTLDLKEVTAPGEVITLSVTGNTEAVYNMVKDFIKAYNELLTDMNTAYNAASARGFNPLTDEQKESMTEEQIKKWEDKIKDALLRRDNTLGGLINIFRTSMGNAVDVNGKRLALTSFGITTKDYSEKGILHISGDDDFNSYTSDNKLMEALTKNPEEVMEVLTKLGDDLYTSLMDKMKRTSLSSALTVYNDKEIDRTLKDYKDDLKKLEKKLAAIEEKYYKQFAAMESAMSKMNTQSAYLSSMLGTGGK